MHSLDRVRHGPLEYRSSDRVSQAYCYDLLRWACEILSLGFPPTPLLVCYGRRSTGSIRTKFCAVFAGKK